MRIALYYLLTLTVVGCDLLQKGKEDKPVARVYDEFLYQKDLFDIVPDGATSEDSSELARQYINNWVEERLVLHLADMNLPEELKDVEKQLESYRSSLLRFTYQKEFIRQKLDTNVTANEIEAYYNKNQHNFELKDYIVQVIYIKMEKTAPKFEMVSRLYKLDGEENQKKLEEYCLQYAVNSFLDREVWLYFDDLLKEVPVKTYNKERFLKNNRFVEMQDENYRYLLRILDYRLKDSTSPLSMEQEKIWNIIINQRKIKLIEKMKKDIYEDALTRNNFEIYD